MTTHLEISFGSYYRSSHGALRVSFDREGRQARETLLSSLPLTMKKAALKQKKIALFVTVFLVKRFFYTLSSEL